MRYIELGALAAALVLLGIFAVATRTVKSFSSASEEVQHGQEVRLRLAESLSHLKEYQANSRAYLISGEERMRAARQQNLTDFRQSLDALRSLTSGGPAEQPRDLENLGSRVQQLDALYESYVELRRTSGLPAVTARAAGDTELKRLAEEIRNAVSSLQDVENRRVERLMQKARADAHFTLTVLIGGLALAVGLVVGVILMLRREFRRQSEAASVVQAARSYAESIVDTVREPLLILTQDLRVNSANRPFFQNFETCAAETVGRPFAEISAGVWAIPELLDALSTIVPEHGELRDFKVARDFPGLGSKVMLLNARKLYRIGNNTSMLLLALEDITERERMQQALEHERYLLGELMDNATECIYFKDTASRFTRINRGLAARFGLAEPAQAIGKTDFDFYGHDHAQPAFDDEQAVMRNGKSIIKEERETWPDGHVSWVLTVKLPLRDAAGNIVGTYGLSRDITERKDAEEKLEQLNLSLRARGAELEAVNRELEAFSYSVSHDLRAPLRHIDYFAGALLKQLGPQQLDAKSQRHLNAISASARGMGQLIDDLLAFARIGRVELRRLPVRLDEIVDQTRQALQTEVNGRSIDWVISPLPNVHGDPVLLRQVFANLLGNAVKYTRSRAPARIEITTREGEPGEVVIVVRDNGVGFDMRHAGKLFGVFQRLHTAQEFEGTGVGLANVRRIVERHGGRVWAEAQIDQGATFFISLPTRPSAMPTTAPS